MYFGLYLVSTDESTASSKGILPGPIRAHIWVMAGSPEQAETLSLSYMKKYNLNPIERVGVWHSNDLPLHDLGTSESRLYRRALEHGIALDLIADSDNPSNISSFRPWEE